MAARKKATAATDSDLAIVSYKGFDRDWKCRDYQYEVGKTFEHTGSVSVCNEGFHACEYPLHVLRHYRPATSRFAVVEQSGTLIRHDEDSKVASSRISITAEIDIAGLVDAAITYTMDRCTPAEGATSGEANGSVCTNGKNKSATASGYSGAATASGNYGAATASGEYGAATASGNSGAATASGYSGAATASGNYGAATASGLCGKARGKDGCALFLVYRNTDLTIVHAKALIVGRDGIKPDTFYMLAADGTPEMVSDDGGAS